MTRAEVVAFTKRIAARLGREQVPASPVTDEHIARFTAAQADAEAAAQKADEHREFHRV